MTRANGEARAPLVLGAEIAGADEGELLKHLTLAQQVVESRRLQQLSPQPLQQQQQPSLRALGCQMVAPKAPSARLVGLRTRQRLAAAHWLARALTSPFTRQLRSGLLKLRLGARPGGPLLARRWREMGDARRSCVQHAGRRAEDEASADGSPSSPPPGGSAAAAQASATAPQSLVSTAALPAERAELPWSPALAAAAAAAYQARAHALSRSGRPARPQSAGVARPNTARFAGGRRGEGGSTAAAGVHPRSPKSGGQSATLAARIPTPLRQRRQSGGPRGGGWMP